MTRISQLPTTAFPSLDHEFPASKDGETVKLTVSQVRDTLAYQASEIARGASDVDADLSALENDKADTSYVDSEDNALADALAAGLSAKVNLNGGNIGANGPALRAALDAGILTGFRNKLFNGDHLIAQRGNSGAATTGIRYLTDRWKSQSNGNTIAWSRRSWPEVGPGIPGRPVNALRAQVVGSATAASYAYVAQLVEDVRTLAGKKATYTFYAKQHAGSPAKLGIEFAQSFGSGGSASVLEIGVTPVNLTTGLARYDVVVDLPSVDAKTIGDGSYLLVTTWLSTGADRQSRSGGIGNQDFTVDLTHHSLVEGDATAEPDPFEYRPTAVELGICKRYYERVRCWFRQNVVSGNNYGNRQSFETEKRVDPTRAIEAVLANQNFPATIGGYTASLTGSDAKGLEVFGAASATSAAGFFLVEASADAEL